MQVAESFGSERNGEDYTGQITFDAHERTVMGMLYDVPGLSMVDFAGKRDSGPAMLKGMSSQQSGTESSLSKMRGIFWKSTGELC